MRKVPEVCPKARQWDPGCPWTFGGGLQEEWGRVGNCRLDLEYDEKNLMTHYG